MPLELEALPKDGLNKPYWRAWQIVFYEILFWFKSHLQYLQCIYWYFMYPRHHGRDFNTLPNWSLIATLRHGNLLSFHIRKLKSSISLLCCAVFSLSIMSDSLSPYGLQPSKLLCPWGFSRQEHWSGLPCPPPGDLPNPGIKPRSPTLQTDSLPSEPPGKPYTLLHKEIDLFGGKKLYSNSQNS